MRGLMNNPALESIHFQSLGFFRELVAIFEEIREEQLGEEDDAPNAALYGMFTGAIKNHTGMNVAIGLDGVEFCVDIPEINRNNILINSSVKIFAGSNTGFQLISAASDLVARGGVNLKTGKVTGVFAEVSTTLHIPVDFVRDHKYTSEELAAFVLHEVGHLYTYYEFMSRTLVTNQVLAGLSKVLDGSGATEQREHGLMLAKKALGLEALDAKALAESTDKTTVETVVITQVAAKSKHELGENIYDLSTWEYLSDEYVARQGAGRHLVTGMDKLHRSNNNISFRSTVGYVTMEALKLGLFLGNLALATAVVGGGAVHLGGFAAITAPTMLALFAMDGVGAGHADLPGARFRRVRHQVVQALKDPELVKGDHRRLADDLQAIDQVLQYVNDRRQLVGVIWDAVNVFGYKGRDQKKLQQNLEELAANELFVHAAALKHHA